jgi:hypothetical protein
VLGAVSLHRATADHGETKPRGLTVGTWVED